MLVVFDLDDTLYLERDYVRSGFRAVSQDVCNDPGGAFFSHAWRLFEQGRRGRIFDETLAALGARADAAAIDRLVNVYRNHRPDIALPDDARSCLEEMARQHDLALITDGPAASQWQKLRALGLDKVISRMIVTDDRGRDWWKPSPHAFAELQGTRPASECVYIADNPRKDFTAPRQLGWKTVRVRREGAIWRDEPDGEAAPDAVVSDLCSIASLIHAFQRP